MGVRCHLELQGELSGTGRIGNNSTATGQHAMQSIRRGEAGETFEAQSAPPKSLEEKEKKENNNIT